MKIYNFTYFFIFVARERQVSPEDDYQKIAKNIKKYMKIYIFTYFSYLSPGSARFPAKMIIKK